MSFPITRTKIYFALKIRKAQNQEKENHDWVLISELFKEIFFNLEESITQGSRAVCVGYG